MKNLKLTNKFYRFVGITLFSIIAVITIATISYAVITDDDKESYYKANEDFGYHWHVEGECYCE